jgi:hypothetical protein
LIFRPSSSRRTFSSRVPNRVSIWGPISMLFFIQYLAFPPAHWMHGCLGAEGGKIHFALRGTGRNTPARVRTNDVWRWNQPRMLAPRCKQLPLRLGYPRPTTRVNAAKSKFLLQRNNPMHEPPRTRRYTKECLIRLREPWCPWWFMHLGDPQQAFNCGPPATPSIMPPR